MKSHSVSTCIVICFILIGVLIIPHDAFCQVKGGPIRPSPGPGTVPGANTGNTGGASSGSLTGSLTGSLKGSLGGSGDGSPSMSVAQAYAVAVCLSGYEPTPDCRDKTPLQASKKMATVILEQYFKGVEHGVFRVVMPSLLPQVEQIQLLRKIEYATIAIVEARMLEDVRNLKAFSWETPAERQQKQGVIMEDATNARREASNGSNWSHNWDNDKPSHDFHTGEAYRQLKSISISGWRGQ